MIFLQPLLNYLPEISATWQLPPLTQLKRLRGIHSTECKQTKKFDSLSFIGVYIQKMPFYKKIHKIKNIYKDIAHLFCFKRFYFNAVFFMCTWIEHNKNQNIFDLLCYICIYVNITVFKNKRSIQKRFAMYF